MKIPTLVASLALITLAAWPPPAPAAEPANTEALGDFSAGLEGWRYNGGWEFKGSRGRLVHEPSEGHNEPGAARLTGEFEAGGSYVAMTRQGSFSEPAAVRFRVKPEGLSGLDIRLGDGRQQIFQYSVPLEGGGEWQEVVIHVPDTPAKSHWGGPNDGVWSGELTQVWICLPRRFCGESKTASCLVDDVEVIPRP